MLFVLFKRFLGHQGPEDELLDEQSSLNTLIANIQSGDVALRNRILSQYRPFIAKSASKLCKRYIDPQRDDEYSVALSAFNEAINHYSPAHGNSFLSFAETVIRRRLIDYIRRETKFRDQIPLTSFEIEDEDSQYVNPVEIQESIVRHSVEQEAEERRMEILHYSDVLRDYGITMKDLVEGSPKHTDSRNMLLQIGTLIANRPELASQLRSKKTLPIKDILQHVNVARKTLERNRKYIIAVAIVQMGEFHYLKQYLHVPEQS